MNLKMLRQPGYCFKLKISLDIQSCCMTQPHVMSRATANQSKAYNVNTNFYFGCNLSLPSTTLNMSSAHLLTRFNINTKIISKENKSVEVTHIHTHLNNKNVILQYDLPRKEWAYGRNAVQKGEEKDLGFDQRPGAEPESWHGSTTSEECALNTSRLRPRSWTDDSTHTVNHVHLESLVSSKKSTVKNIFAHIFFKQNFQWAIK